MFDIQRKTIQWGGRALTLESGRIARQDTFTAHRWRARTADDNRLLLDFVVQRLPQASGVEVEFLEGQFRAKLLHLWLPERLPTRQRLGSRMQIEDMQPVLPFR